MAMIKDWIMDMEDMVYKALEIGFSSYEDVLAYVNTYMVADAAYVREVLEKYHADWE